MRYNDKVMTLDLFLKFLPILVDQTYESTQGESYEG